MKATDISNPEYFHKVVDCQYACPVYSIDWSATLTWSTGSLMYSPAFLGEPVTDLANQPVDVVAWMKIQ